MEIVGITLARVVSLLDVSSADPRGRSSLPDAIRMLAERYSFLKAPQTLEEMNVEKGIEFSVGKLGAINIDKMTFLQNGMVVDTRSSTSDSDKVVEDFLLFVHESFGATAKPTRQMVLSNIVFRSELRLEKMHPVLTRIAETVNAAVSHDFGQPLDIEPTMIAIGADLSQIKLQPSAFTIERRLDTPFSAGMYFSAAPVRTETHLSLIAEFESALLK